MIVIDRLLEVMESEISQLGERLGAVGELVTESAKQFAPKDELRKLMDSITFVNNPEDLEVVISAGGEDVPYAATQEFGNDNIIPDKSGSLTIPISPDAAHHRAEDFPDLFRLHSLKDGNTYLARKSGSSGVEIMFLLVKHAQIPPSPYLRPAVEQNIAGIERILVGH